MQRVLLPARHQAQGRGPSPQTPLHADLWKRNSSFYVTVLTRLHFLSTTNMFSYFPGLGDLRL